MDAEVVTQLMLSQQLLNEEIVLAASSDHQKNCLIVEKVRVMSLQTLQFFCELLLMEESQKHIGKMLINGMCHIALNYKGLKVLWISLF